MPDVFHAIYFSGTDHFIAESATRLGENRAPRQTGLAPYWQDRVFQNPLMSVKEIKEHWWTLADTKRYVLIDRQFGLMKSTNKSIGLDEWKLFFHKLRTCFPQIEPDTAAIELMKILNRDDLSDGGNNIL